MREEGGKKALLTYRICYTYLHRSCDDFQKEKAAFSRRCPFCSFCYQAANKLSSNFYHHLPLIRRGMSPCSYSVIRFCFFQKSVQLRLGKFMVWLNLSSYTTEGQKKPQNIKQWMCLQEENDRMIASVTGSNF